MENVIIIAVLVVILAFAIGYIVRANKRGAKCIGCPSGDKCSGCCGCGGTNEAEYNGEK